jgi:hypothetical protein
MLGVLHSRAFDFQRYDPCDSYHRYRLRLLMRYEERLRYAKYQHATMLYIQAVANTPGKIEYKSREESHGRAFELLQTHYGQSFPWAAQTTDPRQTTTEDEAAKLRAAWVAIWGDPNDPEVAAKIARTADSLMRGTRELKMQAARLPQGK